MLVPRIGRARWLPVDEPLLLHSGFKVEPNFILTIDEEHYHWQHELPECCSLWQDEPLADRPQADHAGVSPSRAQDAITTHRTQQPVGLYARPIENNSLPGQAIYESFSGSGTTIIAAEMSGRWSHAVGLSPPYRMRRCCPEGIHGALAVLEAHGASHPPTSPCWHRAGHVTQGSRIAQPTIIDAPFASCRATLAATPVAGTR